MLTPSLPAPEDYYQNNCCTLLAFVLERYHDLLLPAEAQHYERYLAASTDAQRLVARLLTRRGPLFRVDALEYREITSITAAIDELEALGLVELNPNTAGDQLLKLLRKDEVMDLYHEHNLPKSWRKQILLDWIVSARADAQIRRTFYTRYSAIRLANLEFWELARVLFFGEASGDWSTFVLNDLGMIQYEEVSLHARQFDRRSELERYLSVRALNNLSYQIDEQRELHQALLQRLAAVQGDRYIAKRRDRAILRIARHLERSQLFDDALTAYACVTRHPARERCVRLLHKTGRQEEADRLLAEAKRNPFSEEEAQFCERFGQRRRGFQPETFTVEMAQIDTDVSIEAVALSYLAEERELQLGGHVENALVSTLTGLVYWPVIFSEVPGAFTNPFQSGPNDLYAEDFASVREGAIRALEKELMDRGAVYEHINRIIRDKWLRANSLVSWRMIEQLPLVELLPFVPESHIRALTAFQVRRLWQFRTGLPDLVIVDREGRYELVEVKGPNDQLQPVQRLWFKHLAAMGIPARIMKIKVSAPGGAPGAGRQ